MVEVQKFIETSNNTLNQRALTKVKNYFDSVDITSKNSSKQQHHKKRSNNGAETHKLKIIKYHAIPTKKLSEMSHT